MCLFPGAKYQWKNTGGLWMTYRLWGWLKVLIWDSFPGCLWPIISIFGPGMCMCLSQYGLQLASSCSICPSPRLRGFSVHVSSWEIHKNAPSPGLNALISIPSQSITICSCSVWGLSTPYCNMLISTYTAKAFGKF